VKHEFNVIGAGVIGSSIAYHLARAGAQVTLYDPSSGEPPSASWASAGGVRRQDRDPREWPLALEAWPRWPVLAEELGAEIEFVPGGHLHVSERAEALEGLGERASRESSAGLEVRMVDAREAGSLAPILAPTVVGGVFSAGDGQANPRLVTKAFREAAVRHGARFIPAAGGASPAAMTVLALGSWTSQFVDLPVQPAALQMLLSDPAPPVLAPTIGSEERALSFKQLPSGAFFIGGGWPAEFDEQNHRCKVLQESVEGSWRTACELIPALRESKLSQSFCGLEGMSFDGVPLIGRLSDDLYVAAGFSGHGFQLAPAVGRAVADDLLGRPVPELAALSPTRARAERRP
jgi:sarcosine oxidase, subunit beta